ncbi:Type IV pilus biogenesis and competence protein PilQ precursor [Planctomycetes bacterium Pla163]|uniref:Type IV pilus biogenesis and competence protein PilQ n=1 Tax=Rohdeia mirabilis TaxID=2528008 RepID=A0A518D0P3_9BACT|nr:Type IV pilus biogenesis and competence protein PilQ precursor [Planctomycetes bacterium Pla163]
MNTDTRTLSALFAFALCASACHHPSVRIPERTGDRFDRLAASPLLLELPEDTLEEVAHMSGGVLSISDGERFLLDFPGTPLREALNVIGTMANVTLLADDQIEGTVEARFENITLDEAFQTLLRQYDLAVLPGPGSVYFVERLDDPSLMTDFVQLVNVRAEDVAANLTALVDGDSRVIVDNDRNVVCVIGTQGDVATVRRYLQEVDTLKDQVLVEVHIFEVSYDDGFDFGSVIDLVGTTNGNAASLLSSFGQSGGFTTTLADDDGDFTATIDMVRRYVTLDLVSSPRVLAVTNTPAVVDVVREIPYIETTSTTSGTTTGVGAVVQETVQFKEAGLKLELTPSIQEFGYLQVKIAQTISEQIGEFNSIPIIDRRTLDTTFLVQDKQTIVLGGLVQERQSEERRGVPFLMHLPVLGQLFRADSDSLRKQELLVFVTPRILSPRQAALLTPHYQDEFRAYGDSMGNNGIDPPVRVESGDATSADDATEDAGKR